MMSPTASSTTENETVVGDPRGSAAIRVDDGVSHRRQGAPECVDVGQADGQCGDFDPIEHAGSGSVSDQVERDRFPE